MREESRVPPSRQSSDAADRPADTALAPPEPEGRMPESAEIAASSMSAPGESAESPSALPRRTRGTNGARPPVRVERPVLPDSFLERFRAAAAASDAREAAEELKAAESRKAQDKAAERTRSAAQSSPVSSRLPKRARGTNGAPKPSAQLQSSFGLGKTKQKPAAPDASTQPIPVIPASPEVKSPGGAPDRTAQAAADQQQMGPRQDAAQAEPTGQTRTAEDAAARAQPQSKPARRAARKGPPDTRPPAQGNIPAKPQAAGRKAKSRAGEERTGRSYRVAGLLLIVVGLAVAWGTFATLHGKGHRGHSSFVSSAKISPAIRNAAGVWVARQVAASDTVGCDPVMCRVLQTHGIVASRMRVLWPGSENLAGCSVVIATPAVAEQFGARLSAVYAPGIIARFGSGTQQISVRAVAPHGAAVYRSDVAKDLLARKAAGAELVGPAAGQISPVERRELAAGQVDSRIIVVLAGIEKHPVQVVGFGDAGPGVTRATAPFRSVDLAVTSSASKRAMLAALDAQAAGDPQYLPSRRGTVHLPNGRLVLRIEFAAPSPLGIFGY